MATIITVCKIVHDKETNEWIVQAYTTHNVRVPAADYFTDDKADAMQTAIAMLDACKPAGTRVEIDTRKRLVWWTPIPEAPTAEQIRTRAIAQRTAQGLKMRLLTPDGVTTLYPKDHATKQAWLADAQRKGYTVLEGGAV